MPTNMVMRVIVRAAQGLAVLVVSAPILVLAGLLFFPAAIEALGDVVGLDVGALRAAVVRSIPTSSPRPLPTPPNAFDKDAINAVPLAELPKNAAIASMELTRSEGTGPTSGDPYGFALDFVNVTITAVVKSTETNPRNGLPTYVWLAVVVPGERLARQPQGLTYRNFDGTEAPGYSYRGFTAWLLLNEDMYSATLGSQVAHFGMSQLFGILRPGNRIPVIAVSMNEREPFRRMNRESYERLQASLGKPSDRMDQTFLFKVNAVFLEP